MPDPFGSMLDHEDRPRDGQARLPRASSIEVRALRTHREFLACVDLQREVWGSGFSEHVPASLLKIAPRIGGVTAGAFDEAGALLGFVFGMTGIDAGRPVHWSDMLAVRADVRNLGIGRRLKEFQREALLSLGVATIYWTFDPLLARNAHLNFNRLGVRAVEYATDLYGDSDSPLHEGIGTDRWVVAWDIAADQPRDARDRRASAPPPEVQRARILNASDRDGVPTMPDADAFPAAAPLLRVEIPLEIGEVQARSLTTAALWRATTRRTLLWALEHAYAVRGFYRDDAAERGYYVLSSSVLSSPPSSPVEAS